MDGCHTCRVMPFRSFNEIGNPLNDIFASSTRVQPALYRIIILVSLHPHSILTLISLHIKCPIIPRILILSHMYILLVTARRCPIMTLKTIRYLT